MDDADGRADPIEKAHTLIGTLWRRSIDRDLYAFKSRLVRSGLVHLVELHNPNRVRDYTLHSQYIESDLA